MNLDIYSRQVLDVNVSARFLVLLGISSALRIGYFGLIRCPCKIRVPSAFSTIPIASYVPVFWGYQNPFETCPRSALIFISGVCRLAPTYGALKTFMLRM